MENPKEKRIKQLKHSFIWTPKNKEELQIAKDRVDYSRSIGDMSFFWVQLQSVVQGNEYMKLTGQI